MFYFLLLSINFLNFTGPTFVIHFAYFLLYDYAVFIPIQGCDGMSLSPECYGKCPIVVCWSVHVIASFYYLTIAKHYFQVLNKKVSVHLIQAISSITVDLPCFNVDSTDCHPLFH